MDSSLRNPSYYDLWQPPSAPPLPPHFPHQFHSEWFNWYYRSRHHHQDFHNYMYHQDFPWESLINEPASYYFQPLPVLHESPSISRPSYNFSCTEPRDLSQSASIGYMERRFYAGSDPNFQLDYGNRARDCSNDDWDGNFGSRDGFARNDFRDVRRVEENYRECGQFYSDFCLGYGNFPYGATLHPDIIRNSASNWGTGSQRWVETPKDDCVHSENERHFYYGKRKGSDERNRTTKKPRKNESLLLGTEIPRPHQKVREKDGSRLPAHFSEKRLNSFRGENHSDCGSVEKQTVDGKGTSCTNGKVMKKETFTQPTLSDIENLSMCSEGGVSFPGNSMSCLQSQPCEDEISKEDMDGLSSRNLQMEEVNDNNFTVETSTTSSVDSLDRTVASQAESKNFSQSQACENEVNSSTVSVSKNESTETTPLDSTAEIDNDMGSDDAGKYTCLISISSSPKNVAGKGSSNVQPVERNSVLLHSICKNNERWSNGSVLDRELSSAMYLEDESFAPNQDTSLSSQSPAETSSVDRSFDLSCRGLKACLSKPIVSLSKGINVGASEFHLNQEDRERAPTCDNFSSSSVSEIENTLAIGNTGSSGSKTVTDSETQLCSAGCEFFPNDHIGWGTSDVMDSFRITSMDKDLVDDPLRISSCLVPDSSVCLCLSPSVSVTEQIQNSASPVEVNCSSHCGIIEKEMGRAENMDVEIQEEKVKLTSETSQCRTSGTNFVTVSRDSMFRCGSSSSLPSLIIGQIKNDTHAATDVDETNNSKERNREEMLLDVSQEQIEKLTEVPIEKKLIDEPSDFGSQKISANIANSEVHVGEALSFGGKVSGTESSSNSDVILSKSQSHADEKIAVSHVKDYAVARPHPDSQSKTTLSSISEKTENREFKFMQAAQKSSLHDTRKDASHPINVAKHHRWHQKSNTSASPLVALKPKVTVQSTSTYVRKGNSLLRKPSPDSLERAQTLQRDSRPPSHSTSSGKCALCPGMDPLANGLRGSSVGETDNSDFIPDGLRSYASNCQPKKNSPKLESSNPLKMLYVKRKANQLVAAFDTHGASNSESPPSTIYFRRSKNQLFRKSEKLANKTKSLPDATLNSQTAVMRQFNQSKFSSVWTLKEPLPRKANRVHISPQKIVPQPATWKRVTYWRRLMNPASALRNGSRSTIRSVWTRNGNQLVRDPKKRTHVMANEKIRWSLQNARLRLAKRRNYCQFFTRFGECNKDDGTCPYIHDPLKIAVCTKFLSGLCANPDCKLAHKVVPENMPDCYYFLQGLCNNESCPYRHVHVNQNSAICEGFLRGYCSDGNEMGICIHNDGQCWKKHTYSCQVFEATGSCPQGSECKLHHPKNRSKGKKRKRASEPWQQNACGRYFGSQHKDLPESEPVLVNELAIIDDAVFGEESPDFIRLDVSEQEARENMDSSTTESVSDDSEDQNPTNEVIRPVGLMQK